MSDLHWPRRPTRARYYAHFVDNWGDPATLPILAADAASANRIAREHCMGRGLRYDGLAQEPQRHHPGLTLTPRVA